MSGIAAVAAVSSVRQNGAHFERWVSSLTGSEREPKAVWTKDAVALAACGASDPQGGISHFVGGEQPVTVVANARIDARAELRCALTKAGQPLDREHEDAELIARAYSAWGMQLLDRLIGDFAFVLYDEGNRSLVAARDHFGVRQLYYAATDQGLVLSSSAKAVFRHPWVSRRLDDQAVVDYLVHDQVDHDATLFADIRRLRAGHVLVWDGASASTRPYWVLEPRMPFQGTDCRDYPRELRGLLRTAVADRTRGLPAGVLMSGGVDSTAVAAAAREELQDPAAIRVYTAYSSGRMVDGERDYAALVAVRLGLEGELHDTDPYVPLQCPASSQLSLPIPDSTTIGSSTIDLLARAAPHGKVVLTGIGPDGLLLPDPILDEIRRAGPTGYARTLSAAARHVRTYQRRPPVLLRRRRAPGPATVPDWLVDGIGGQYYRGSSPWESETRQFAGSRALAHRVMARGWAYMLESYAAAGEASGVNVAHPFLDLRIVDFCLRIPAVPWCWDKHVLREAMSPAIPVSVTRRRKTPLRHPWLVVAARAGGTHSLVEMKPLEQTRRYYSEMDFASLATLVLEDPYTHLRPVALDVFLRVWSAQETIS